ncbi:MAG: malto-oligosyltrehalose trehalohydrolase [Acetobacterales bacterium]
MSGREDIASMRHDMPFGAQVLDNARVRFRLWAPGQENVTVVLADQAPTLPMEHRGDGWFETIGEVEAGARYAFALGSGERVPDPASRGQDDDVHGWSVVVDPAAYRWRNTAWRGRPWRETVLYELHIGTFTPEGTFAAAARRLDLLAEAGITAIELMPVSDFAGSRGWGYDGVLPFAPERAYGRPEELKALIDAAHDRDMTVFLDVVYNHFGPEGNYLHLYAPDFFVQDGATPWGTAIAFNRRPVRDFFISNALYWLREFRFDGLRFDAVDWIRDSNGTAYLKELAGAVRRRIAIDDPERHVHLVLEHDANDADLLERGDDARPLYYDAQWNDDWHHTAHALLTGETDGYYGDYADSPPAHLARAMASGYVYQGQTSRYRNGERRGKPSGHLPPEAFVNFLQNHDQIGNRALGERLRGLADSRAVDGLTAALLLSPQVPLLFMGEEWGSLTSFRYFCDFHDELADAVREGRRNEFKRFAQFSTPEARERIPDPNAEATFRDSALDWNERKIPDRADTLALVSELLSVRRRRILPLLAEMDAGASEVVEGPAGIVHVRWRTTRGGTLTILLNTTAQDAEAPGPLDGETLFSLRANIDAGRVEPWGLVCLVGEPA